MRLSSIAALTALIFFTLVHLCYLSTPFVSGEFVYSRYAEKLLTGGMGEDLMHFLELIANPLSSLYVIVPFQVVLGPSESAARLPSFLSGIALVVFLVIAVRRIKGAKTAVLAACIILLNPMYWSCSSLAYTDVPFCFFSGGGLLFCILALLYGRPVLHWPAALFLALSALIKFNGVVFLLLAAVLVVVHLGRGGFKYLIPYVILPVVVDFPVYLVIVSRYGFLIHPRLSLLHRPRLDMVYIYFPAYLLWLGLFMGPLLLLPCCRVLASIRRKTISLILAAGLLLICALFCLSGWGDGYLARLHEMGEYEMNIGWFELLLGDRAFTLCIVLILALSAVAFVDIIAWMRRGSANLFLGIWLISVLLIGSVSRPANRYLLFILVPLAVYLADIFASLDDRWRIRWPLRVYFVTSLILLALVCFVTTSFWIGARGSASAEAVRYVTEHRLSPAYLDWRVTSHSRYLADESLLTGDEVRARYLVVGRFAGEEARGGSVLFSRGVSLMGRPVVVYEVIEKNE